MRQNAAEVMPGPRESTMQDVDLSVADILEHGLRNHASARVHTILGDSAGDGYSETTFAEIGERAARLAAALRAIGVRIGDVVGTLAWNTREHLESYFAVPSMGAVIHTLNLRFSPDQLAWCLNDAGTSIVIVDETLLATLVACLESAPGVRTVVRVRNGGTGDTSDIGDTDNVMLDALRTAGVTVLDYDDLIERHDPLEEWVRVPERSAAALCYTSGTTGNPKGVVYSHRSLWLQSLVNTSGTQFGLSPADMILPAVPMFHVMGWNLFYSAFIAGSDLILTNRFIQPGPLLRAIEQLKPTFGAGVPTIWTDIAARADSLPDRPYDLSSLTRLSSGGAVVPDRLIEWWQAGHGVFVLHGCGMTETSSTMTSGLPRGGLSPDAVADSQRTQGQFVIGVQARIVDEHGHPRAHDGRSEGELQLRGPWVANGYLSSGPAVTADGWLPTGDIASIGEDGFVRYTDRIKDVIKSGGEWISSLALEAHLVAHPGVREAAVIAIEDERWQERPVAIVVPSDDRPTGDELADHVAKEFPRFWIPDKWVFVEAVPRTSVGKFDKKLLRDTFPDVPGREQVPT